MLFKEQEKTKEHFQKKKSRETKNIKSFPINPCQTLTK